MNLFLQLQKCARFNRFTQIDELEDKVGEVKWSSVKDKTLAEKLDYWNSQYETMACEQAKMRTLVISSKTLQFNTNSFNFIFSFFSLLQWQKNICILLAEDAKQKALMDQAKRAGLQDKQIEPAVNLITAMSASDSMSYKTTLLV